MSSCMSRKNDAATSETLGVPPEKKPSVQESPSQALSFSLAGMDVTSPVAKEPGVKRIIKLKRPVRTAPPM